MTNAKRLILLVDDEPDILKTMGKRLELAGFDVVTAANGEEVLTKVHATRPQLIILDLMLPKLNGYEVCAKLRQDSVSKQIPIIMFTARGDTPAQLAGLMFGADAYISKTSDFDVVLEQVNTLLPAASSS
jgi:DNA-binding response OmpR family regulator